MNELEAVISKIDSVQYNIARDGRDLTNDGVVYLLELLKNFCYELKEKEETNGS